MRSSVRIRNPNICACKNPVVSHGTEAEIHSSDANVRVDGILRIEFV